MKRVLVVEDEASIREMVALNLKMAGWEVVEAPSAERALELMHHGEECDAALLDIMLPKKNGIEVLKELRTFSELPVIMLTAKGEIEDRIIGLELGADDYLIKPFSPRELVARVRALLRRAGGPAAQTPQRAPLLTVGDLSLDTEERVAIRDGKTIDLTAKEYDLIELLMKNPRRVYSRESLMDLVWGYSYAGDYRTVDVHIRRLREKLEPDPANPVYIMTKWGVGYYFKGEEQPTV